MVLKVLSNAGPEKLMAGAGGGEVLERRKADRRTTDIGIAILFNLFKDISNLQNQEFLKKLKNVIQHYS